MRIKSRVVLKMTGTVAGIMDQLRKATDRVGYRCGDMYPKVLLCLLCLCYLWNVLRVYVMIFYFFCLSVVWLVQRGQVVWSEHMQHRIVYILRK